MGISLKKCNAVGYDESYDETDIRYIEDERIYQLHLRKH